MLGRHLALAVVAFAVTFAAAADATSVFVGTLSGHVFRVDPDGSATLLATASGAVGGVARAANGRIFICVGSAALQVQVIETNGTVSNFGPPLPAGHGCRDLVVSTGGRVFLLDTSAGPTAVREIFSGGQPSQVLFDVGGVITDGGAIGLSLAPDGRFFLATQEQTFGRILAATLGGNIATLATWPPLTSDVAADGNGQIFALVYETSGPNANNRSLRRLNGSNLDLIAGANAIGEMAARLSLGDPGEFFVVGGGFGTSTAYVQRVLADGSATVLRSFPDESLTSLDDDHFESSNPPAEIPVIGSLVSMSGMLMIGAFAVAGVWRLRRSTLKPRSVFR